jgi:hypothetical protein
VIVQASASDRGQGMSTSGSMKVQRSAQLPFSDLNAVALRFCRQVDVTSGFHPQQIPNRLAGVGVKEFKSIAIIGALFLDP